MSRHSLLAGLGALALALSIPTEAHAAEDANFRRFALLAGANDGGEGRVPLRFAVDDARAVGSVLGQLGGVTQGDTVMLTEPDRGDLIAALGDVRARVAAAEAQGARTELLVYYSGHSDEDGLLLGGDRFGYDELRTALEKMPADVRVVILDSCSSGALVRGKGGTMRPAFVIDQSVDVRGTAFLTSSSADEAAQESDRLGASFFTHYLVSGLRGAADYTQDGRVTLTEAYQFAYAETLARTSKTQAGPQHPAHDMRLAGTGDLVMTDVRATTAGLVADEAIEGRLHVRDSDGRLVAELYKPAGRRVELGLSPGRYVVLVDTSGRLREASFEVAAQGMVRLSSLPFREVGAEHTRSRGDAPADPAALADPGAPAEAGPDYDDVAFSVGIVPSIASGGSGRDQRQHVALSLGLNSAAALDGTQVALLANHVRDEASGLQVATALNVGGELSGVQLTAGVNHADEVAGGQLAAGANWSDRDVTGVQLTAGGNWAGGAVRGVQGAAGVNVARRGFRGVQATAGINVALEPSRGVQGTAGVNVATDLVGAQLGAGVNVASGEVKGVQASVVNVATDVKGAQVSTLNLARGVKGAQVGLVNIAKDVEGTQIGLINIADDIKGEPIGLLSFSRTGYNHGKVWMDAAGMANAGVTFGGKHVYTLLSGGAYLQDPTALWTVQLGLGGHIQKGRFWVDLEASAGNLGYLWQPTGDVQTVGLLVRGRATVGFDVARHFAVFVGPTFDVLPYPGGTPLPAPAWIRSGDMLLGEDVVPWQAGAALGVRF